MPGCPCLLSARLSRLGSLLSEKCLPSGFGGRGGGFGDRGGGFGDKGGGFGDRGGGFGDRGGGFGDRGRGFDSARAPERPAHLRNLLAPRSAGGGEGSSSHVGSSEPGTGGDKWDTIFNKSSDRGAHGSADRTDRGGFGERRGFGDRGFGSRGYGDRESEGRSNFGAATQDDRFRNKFEQSIGGETGRPQQPQAQPSAETHKNAEAEAKAAKAAARAEKERLEKERKEAAQKAKERELQEAQERRQRAQQGSDDAFATGKKGEELVDYLKEMQLEVTAASILNVVLSHLEDPLSTKWTSKSEYGAVLAFLASSNMKSQIELLYEVQAHCHKLKFPKIEVKEKQHKLIDVIFRLLFTQEIVDGPGFLGWADDDNDAEVPGKTDAIVQTTDFIAWLREPDLEEFEEEEDDDEGFEGNARTA